ncbi:hypothetical protein GH733_000610 [Mirounga leonina]|nr:hypothetical protein GH733_000610 [Mirounga leonina]
MPFFDVQKRLGLNLDHWMTIQKCLLRQKTMKRLSDITRQRDKLIKEGKYTPPSHHLGKGDPRP